MTDEHTLAISQMLGGRFEPKFITNNHTLQKELRRAWKLARSTLPILIMGATGVGKSWLVQDLHLLSEREGDLKTLECTALAESVVESELFGHAKGSFTGASRDRLGLVESAEKGTLFLDELGDLSAHVQMKLLRAIQDGVIRRVGTGADVHVDVRWIGATNVNLAARVKTGEFRSDLYFRLAHGVVRIPPLCERPEDVPLLTHEYFRRRNLLPNEILSEEAQTALCSYEWPGNVRELFAVLEVALALKEEGPILRRHLQFQRDLIVNRSLDDNDPGIRVGVSVSQGRKLLTQATIRRCKTRADAARMLGISLATLHRWLSQWERPTIIPGDGESDSS